MRLVVGSSAEADPRRAAAAAASAVRGIERPVFALVLCTDDYEPEALAAAVTAELGRIPWAGCSAAGVFAGGAILDRGLVIGLFHGDVRIGVGMAGPVSLQPRAAGAEAATRALASLPALSPGARRSLIVLVDAFKGDGDEVVRGAVQEAGTGIVWAGGGAGDNLRFIRATQFAGGRAASDRVVVIALDAPAQFGIGIRHGWRPYGPPLLVTRASGRVVNELEYEPAFDVYRRVAASRGDDVSRAGFAGFASSHPLGIPQMRGDYIIRDPLGVEPDGSVRCVAEVPDGCIVRVMVGDRDALIHAARDAAGLARRGVEGPPAGTVVFDCVSRRVMLGAALDDELAAIRRALGPSVPMLGCLSFGEIGALGGGVPQFHNKTAVVLTMSA